MPANESSTYQACKKCHSEVAPGKPHRCSEAGGVQVLTERAIGLGQNFEKEQAKASHELQTSFICGYSSHMSNIFYTLFESYCRCDSITLKNKWYWKHTSYSIPLINIIAHWKKIRLPTRPPNCRLTNGKTVEHWTNTSKNYKHNHCLEGISKSGNKLDKASDDVRGHPKRRRI